MTALNGNIFRAIGPVWGESTGHPWQRPVMRILDILFDLRLNKRVSKHSGSRWFDTPSRSLLRHCNIRNVSLSYCCKNIVIQKTHRRWLARK